MSDSLLDQANKAALDAVKADKPAQFTVGGSFDGQQVNGGVTFDRKWSNGWGLSAYARAWYNDSAVIPRDKFGMVAGGEVVKKFVWVVFFLTMLAAPAFAQTTVTPGQLIRWDQATAEAAGVDHFEVKFDGGGYLPAGKTAANDARTAAGNSSFSFAIPALTPGPHTFIVRACLTNVCGPDAAPFAFGMFILSAPTNVRAGDDDDE